MSDDNNTAEALNVSADAAPAAEVPQADPATAETPQEQPEQAAEGSEEQGAEAPQEASDSGLPDREELPETVPMSRFREVYYKQKEAERQLEQIQAQQAQQQQEQAQAPASEKPTLESCDYDEAKFTEELVNWSLKQRDAQQAVKQQQDAQLEQVRTFRDKQTDYSIQNADYQNLCDIADRTGVQFQPHIADVLLTSDQGVKLHHHLLSNPDKLEQLNSANPVQAMREMVALEQKFKAPPKKPTTAPPPIQPVQGGGTETGKTLEQLSKMTPKEYAEYRSAEFRRKHKR